MDKTGGKRGRPTLGGAIAAAVYAAAGVWFFWYSGRAEGFVSPRLGPVLVALTSVPLVFYLGVDGADVPLSPTKAEQPLAAHGKEYRHRRGLSVHGRGLPPRQPAHRRDRLPRRPRESDHGFATMLATCWPSPWKITGASPAPIRTASIIDLAAPCRPRSSRTRPSPTSAADGGYTLRCGRRHQGPPSPRWRSFCAGGTRMIRRGSATTDRRRDRGELICWRRRPTVPLKPS